MLFLNKIYASHYPTFRIIRSEPIIAEYSNFNVLFAFTASKNPSMAPNKEGN